MAANTANTTPIFINKGNTIPVTISAANTASDGSGTLVPIVTATVDGTRVDGVRFRNAQVTPAASSAMIHRIFLSDAAGANFKLIGEINTPAATRSNTVIGATSMYNFDLPIIMQSGQIMSVCQSVYAGVQDAFSVCAFAGNY